MEEKFKKYVSQKTNGTVVQHLQCPETTFYLPLLELQLLQEPSMEQNNLLSFLS